MTDFDIIKENLPKFDFKVYNNICSALDNIFVKYKDLFANNKCNEIVVSRIISMNDKNVNIEIICGDKDYRINGIWTDLITIPIEWIIDEKYMADELRKKNEKI